MDFLDCKICHVPYDEEEHRPRNSPCGHEICSACIRALIKDGIFECPKCRQKNIITIPDDLPICFGLIDVIRAFKTQSISMTKESEPSISGATNDEVCRLHKKCIGHRCLKCQMWICDECLDVHSTLMGCSTVSAPDAVSSMKVKETENIKVLLTCFSEDVNYVSSKIEDHNKKIQELTNTRKGDSEKAEKQIADIFEEAEKQRKVILEQAEKQKKEILERDKNQEKMFLEKTKKHNEGLKMLNNMLDEGSIHKKKLHESENQLKEIHSPYVLMDKIEELTQRRLLLSSFAAKSLRADSLTYLMKAMREGKDTCVEMTIDGEKRSGKLSLHDGNIYVHVLLAKPVSEGSICIAFDRIQKLNFSSIPLVFLELSLGGIVKGRVLLRLNKDSPITSENMVKLMTGQIGKSLQDVKFDYNAMNCIRTCSLPFSQIPVTCRSKGRLSARKGDVIGYFGSGYLEFLYFNVGPYDYGSTYHRFVGTIESGMDILQECYVNYSCGVKVTDCGIVIKQK